MATPKSEKSGSPSPPTRFAVALFPGFQALDVFGPLDILNLLSKKTPLSLRILAATLDPVSTRTDTTGHTTSQAVVPTHAFADGVDDVEVLLVPGGFGTRSPENIRETVEFVRAAYPNLRFLLTVCTGSAVAAMAGVLDGRRATSNKRAWAWATAQGPKVQWVPHARWVTDGNIWTSSGITAGIDMMYAFVADQFGEDVAQELADAAEYVRNTDPGVDPFAAEAENGVAK
ncbi:class I glutamine amidotransferase-like protein [Hypoxylon rubiginosum]|uniref:Class I glutamine amidotransferase-like protein n=1 Tax=Hypoxylon rubiginosum TaxID=110542 RepID=A0ACC0CTP0_9PEZI|nr:class I glutamine amidotransferase-like protein [Hypoxylon rubiginosum]